MSQRIGLDRHMQRMQREVNELTQFAADRELDTKELAVVAAAILGNLLAECTENDGAKQDAFDSLLNIIRRHANMGGVTH